MKKNKTIRTFTDYIIQNRLQFFFTVLCLFLGLVIGSLSSISLSSEKYSSLHTYMDNFMSAYEIQTISQGNVFGFSIYNNIKILLFVWISGLCVWLVPIGLFQIGLKSFKLGFTVTFLVQAYGGKGILIAFVTLIPQILFMIPTLLLYMVFNINFALKLKQLKQRDKLFSAGKELFLKNFLFLVFAVVIMMLCSVIDTFVIPSLLKAVCSF